MAALDAALGIVLLAGYILLIVSLAAGITYAVIRIFPTERNPKKSDKPDSSDKRAKQETPAAKNGEAGAGSLFRRSKRDKT